MLSDSCTRWRKIYNIRNVIYRFFCRFTCASCLNRKTPFCQFGAIHVLLFLQVGVIFDSLMRGNIAIDWTCARVSVCMQLLHSRLSYCIHPRKAVPIMHTQWFIRINYSLTIDDSIIILTEFWMWTTSPSWPISKYGLLPKSSKNYINNNRILR